MNTLEENLTNIFGQKAVDWFSALPVIIQKLADKWSLSNLQPVDNMTYNYVAKAIDKRNKPVVLKISYDYSIIEDEITTLNYFNGHGMIRLLDTDKELNALLLEQAVPGGSLKNLYPDHISTVMDAYVEVVKRLQTVSKQNLPKLKHISKWLSDINNVSSEKIPAQLLSKAIELKDKLLKSMTNEKIIHGDLHHDNILNNTSEWLTIDPKGVIGDIYFEVAAFDFIHSSENNNISELFQQRIALLSEKLNLDVKKLTEWIFVRLIMSAAWHVMDKSDSRRDVTLANEIANLLN